MKLYFLGIILTSILNLPYQCREKKTIRSQLVVTDLKNEDTLFHDLKNILDTIIDIQKYQSNGLQNTILIKRNHKLGVLFKICRGCPLHEQKYILDQIDTTRITFLEDETIFFKNLKEQSFLKIGGYEIYGFAFQAKEIGNSTILFKNGNNENITIHIKTY
jgi:hypothetical protein